MVAGKFGSSLGRLILPVPTLPQPSYAVGGLAQGGVSRGRYTGMTDAASWVVPPWFAVDTKLDWKRRSQVCDLYITGCG